MIRLFDTPAVAQGDWSRRDLLQAGVLGVGGLALSNMLQLESVRRAVAARVSRPARNCIFMFLNGGQAQMDTFDMKPEAPEGIRGPYRPIATSVPGTQVSNMLPRLARLADRYTILRSAKCYYNQVRSVQQEQTATRAALLELERLIRNYPFAPETREGETMVRELRTRLAQSEMQIGDFYLSRSEYTSAAERYRSLLDTYPGLGEDAEALFKLGVCYENMKREDEATRLFHVIVENFPETHIAVLAREHIEAAN